MDSPLFSLQSLSELAGVEARTIRSYIERDLLPGPYGLGPKAAYGQAHLDRLKVIRLLREADREMTLDRIRAFLSQLPAEQIAALAAGEAKLGAAGIPAPPTSTALGYLMSLKGQTPVGQAAPRLSSGPPRSRTPLEELLDVLGAALPRANVARSVRSETWHRVPITPDVELAVRGELDPDTLALLHRVGDHLRHLLMKGTRP